MGQLFLVLGHHFEAVAEVGESGAEVHFVLELFEDLTVVEVSVRKKAVQTTHYIV